MGAPSLFFATMLLLHFYMATFAIAAVLRNINTDQTSLLAFKDHISDPNNILSTNWSSASQVCNWIGITCGSSHHRVISLNLYGMGLVGTVPPHLGNLSFLSELDLSNNSFHSSLPNVLTQLRRLKRIILEDNKFSGEIPSWFVFLPHLKVLSVSYNSFTGTIPSSLFNITSLQRLFLSGNKLVGFLPPNIFLAPSLQLIAVQGNKISGSIPPFILNNSPLRSIGFTNNNFSGKLPEYIFHHLPNLEGLYLSKNQFSGSLPLSLFSCKKLQFLSLSVNKFEGNIPREIGNLTMLKEIYLVSNNFSPGTIPNEIGNLHNLEVLGFQNSSFSGKIPQEIFNISTLGTISLYQNQLSGSLPSNLGSKLPYLQKLVLWENYLSGEIPKYLSNSTNLNLVDFSYNLFSGQIPTTIGYLRKLEKLYLIGNNLTLEPFIPELNIINSLTNCRYLRYLSLGHNPLNSMIPVSIGNLSTSLEHLDFRNCNMRGNIPTSIGNLSGLLGLELDGNQLTGSIPATINKVYGFQYFSISKNQLGGCLPCELCQLKQLVGLNLASNKFSGYIPACIGNISSLRELQLADNNLNSTIPSTLWGNVDLLFLDLSSNELKGSLASEMKTLEVVVEMNLSMNQLSGSIPTTIGELQDLASLSLAQNEFEGPIPKSFGSLVSLETLDLSENILSGVIPKSMEALVYLKSFNVSFNKLEGQIPIGGPFKKFSVQSFMGNKELCGAPWLKLQECKSATSRKSPKTIANLLKYVLPTILAITLLLTSMYMLLNYQKCRKSTTLKTDATVTTWRRFSYYELQQATNGFIDANLIGIGSSGKVYKGILRDGENIAVKVFNLDLEGAFKSFEEECKVLCNVSHPNLTKIISSCNTIDFKALVLSYMCKGNLEKWLHSHDHCLSIIQRLNIMIDVAAALDYLHNGCSIPIVHCDLKPNNVLLDEDMVAHVTDFGISKLLNGGDSITHTMTLATMGYMAPEYGLEGIISRQGDVYSFGILLIETFTQKKPTHEMFQGEFSIKQWVKESYPHVIMDVIDPKLLTKDGGHFTIKRDSFISIMGLALDCLAESPSERKNMKDVLVSLKKIKIRFE